MHYKGVKNMTERIQTVMGTPQVQHTNLSKQAVGALMMALQKSLLEQSDIVPVLEGFKMANSPEGLVVLNPPVVKFNEETTSQMDFGFDVVNEADASTPDEV
tara:strand:- start:635 stop:940 length:306 start_codon:yes stop_codon:yes gene_type:complete